jgi:hypothetical protein
MTKLPDTDIADEVRMTMRMHCRLPATLQVLSSGLRITGDVFDASETGLFFRTEILFPVGTDVRVELVAQGRGLANIDAQVVRVVTETGESGMGVCFRGPIEPVSRFMV